MSDTSLAAQSSGGTPKVSRISEAVIRIAGNSQDGIQAIGGFLARLAGRSSCRAKSRDQDRQRADNPFRGDSGIGFPPRENLSVGRVHLTSPPWVSPKACLHSKVPPANGNWISRNSVIGRQGASTPCNAGEPPASVFPHRIARRAEWTLSKGFCAVKTRFTVTRIADRRQEVGHPSPRGWLAASSTPVSRRVVAQLHCAAG